MAETFTGLKLKGDLGRFGKTEICDVLGVYPMPDEKVMLSNTIYLCNKNLFITIVIRDIIENVCKTSL